MPEPISCSSVTTAQLAAVGAGGGMELLAAAGSRDELADARWFDAPW
ncbi:hypothetical protein [Pseudonocardia parietis]|uniref:Uncharacterized protein n=1 Tax=Pseudonocardia parietis TaxID=570936 RepID=A0ABS4W0D0_9PSEU|nr:hypothetical protein [Pseudonocardia parietis]MBP2369636.1 hypothetical protein [Pseudonocardia parietis]